MTRRTIADLSRENYPPPRVGSFTEAFGSLEQVKARFNDAIAWKGPDKEGKWARFVLGLDDEPVAPPHATEPPEYPLSGWDVRR